MGPRKSIEKADPEDPSKDPRNNGNNGNPAQSAGRVTAQEQDEHPEPLGRDPNEPPETAPA